MKHILFILFGLILLSCNKTFEEPTPVYDDTLEVKQSWDTEYIYGGTVPTNTKNNPLIGTKWVLYKYITGFGTMYPNDTITFVSNNLYKYKNTIRNYNCSELVGANSNKSLTLYFFTPFGGSHYSADIGAFFVGDGVIDNAKFSDLQNSSVKITAWFRKL